MSANHINISCLGKDVSTQRMHDTYVISHLALNEDFTTSDMQAIKCCRLYKGILFIINICNHQSTHLQKSVTDTVTIFNLIHDFNCPSKHHTKIAPCRTWNKAMITLCDESKDNICPPLGQ